MNEEIKKIDTRTCNLLIIQNHIDTYAHIHIHLPSVVVADWSSSSVGPYGPLYSAAGRLAVCDVLAAKSNNCGTECKKEMLKNVMTHNEICEIR
jgi:hypothetical protein